MSEYVIETKGLTKEYNLKLYLRYKVYARLVQCIC